MCGLADATLSFPDNIAIVGHEVWLGGHILHIHFLDCLVSVVVSFPIHPSLPVQRNEPIVFSPTSHRMIACWTEAN